MVEDERLMRRRDLLLAIMAAPALLASDEPPGETDRLLAFSLAWNAYTEKLNRWLRDRSLWRRVVKEWERLR